MKPEGKAITLTAQKKNKKERTILELREKSGKPQDFVIALFGTRDIMHDQDKFNPLFGLRLIGQSRYAISYTFQSLYDGAQWALDGKQIVNQFDLNLTREQQIKILNITRNMGDKFGISEMYDLTINNCLNFVFKVLNSAVNTDPDEHITLRTGETIRPAHALKKLGLIEDIDKFSLFSEEYPDGVEKIEKNER